MIRIVSPGLPGPRYAKPADYQSAITYTNAAGINPRQIWLPKTARPVGPLLPCCPWYDGSPNYKGTNTDPSIMNNTGQIAQDLPVTVVIPNAATWEYIMWYQQFPGGVQEYPNSPWGRRAFKALWDMDILVYPIDQNRVVPIGFSGGGSQWYAIVAEFPELFAGVVINDAFFVQQNMVDAAHQGMIPDGSEIMFDPPIATNTQAWDEYIVRAGHIPHFINISQQFVTQGSAANIHALMDRYNLSGKGTHVDYVSVAGVAPTVPTTQKWLTVTYPLLDHQGLVSTVLDPVYNPTMWAWIKARNRLDNV